MRYYVYRNNPEEGPMSFSMVGSVDKPSAEEAVRYIQEQKPEEIGKKMVAVAAHEVDLYGDSAITMSTQK